MAIIRLVALNATLWAALIYAETLTTFAWAESLSTNFNISGSHIAAKLGSPATNTVHRDGTGALWIGTQDGLYLYDGSHLVIFDSHEKGHRWIPDSNIVDIMENGDGDIYIHTYTQGIFVKLRGNEGFEPLVLPKNGKESDIRKVAIGLDGRLVVAFENAVLIYEDRLGRFSHLDIERQTLDIVALEIDTHSDSLLAISTIEKTYIIELEMQDLQVNHVYEFDIAATALAFNQNGDVYAGTRDGAIVKVAPLSEDFLSISISEFSKGVYISDIQAQKDGILVGTDYGLYFAQRDLSSIENISNTGKGLSSSVVRRLYLDDGYTWVCTLGGLDLLSDTPFSKSTFGKNSAGDVTALAKDDSGRLWIGTYEGLWHRSHSNGKIEYYASDSVGQRVIDYRITAAAFGGDKLWIGYAGSGVQSLNLKSNILETYPFPVASVFVNDILVTQDSIWIATGEKGLFWSDGNSSFSRIGTADDLDDQSLTKLFELDKNNILIFAENRAFVLDRALNELYELSLYFGLDNPKPVLYSVNLTSDGTLWVGTKNHGLFYTGYPFAITENIFLNRMSAEEHWNKFSALSIELDHNENVWVSTDKGILSVRADGSGFSAYATKDGLQENPFNLNASTSQYNGRIFFGGLQGLSSFTPPEVKSTKSAISPRIVRVESNRQSIFSMFEVEKVRLSIEPSANPIVFHFNTLEFLDTISTIYRYKLKNHDKTWTDNGNKTSATYTNLPPGNYTFEVQAANSSGIWNSEGASIDITVLPPPWRTWWAYCLYGLLALMLFWVAHRIYYSFIIDRRAKSLALEMHLAEERADDDMQVQVELQQGVVQSAYEHNQSTISLVREFLEQDSSGRKVSVEKQTLRLAVLSDVDECLFFQAGDPVVDLYKLAEMIFERALPGAATDSASIISINEVTRDLVDSRLAAPVALMLLELIQNAALHAFAENSPAKFVRAQFSRSALGDEEGDYWVLRVSDNGSGFDVPIAEAFEADSELDLVARLVSKLNGSLKLENHEGATVCIRLPGNPIA